MHDLLKWKKVCHVRKYNLEQINNCFVDVDVEIFADGIFENRSMHNRIFLFVPQLESKGQVKSKLCYQIGSDK